MEENVEDPLQNPEAIVKLVTKTGRQSGADGENGPAAERRRQVSGAVGRKKAKKWGTQIKHAVPKKTSEHSHKKEKQGGGEGHAQNVGGLLAARIIVSRARQRKNLGSNRAVWSRGKHVPDEGEGV